MRINKRLVRPLVQKDYSGRDNREYVDMYFLPQALAACLGILFAAFIVVCLTVPFARHMLRKPGPPPKVITKTITVSEMSAAKQAYIKQCERIDDSYNTGIPDVHTNNWTCRVVHT